MFQAPSFAVKILVGLVPSVQNHVPATLVRLAPTHISWVEPSEDTNCSRPVPRLPLNVAILAVLPGTSASEMVAQYEDADSHVTAVAKYLMQDRWPSTPVESE